MLILNYKSLSNVIYSPFIRKGFFILNLCWTDVNVNLRITVEWDNSFKYFIIINKAEIKPYIDGGLNLWFYPGGPSFAIKLGGCANFFVLQIFIYLRDIQIEPVFATGESVFYFAITSGIKILSPLENN